MRFLVEDSGVVRELVWGEGNPLAAYSVQGASLLAVQSEGPKRVLLLGLERRPNRGDQAAITSRRQIRNGFVDSSPYAEVSVERPTSKLGLKVLFPCSRPPLGARVESVPPTMPARSIRIRYGADGRPFLSWSMRQPERFTTYSLRWQW